MSTISVKAIDQQLIPTSTPSIFSGDINTDTLSAAFSDEWTGYTKTAVFYVSEDDVYKMLLQDDACIIPAEVLKTEGKFYLGIMGVNGDKVLTSEVLTYSLGKGAITTDLKDTDPTPDIYSQLLASYDEIKKMAEAWDKKVDPSIQDAINAKNQCLDAIASLHNEIYDMDGGDPFTATYSDDVNGGYPT